MNLKDVEYVIKIADEQQLTRAAEKLFITPSALTQHLNHLEKEIGTSLFFRSRSGWTPTLAGEVYLKSAREMLRLQRETYKRLQDITTARKGFLSIGFPPERGVPMFTSIYPEFHQTYPNIVVNVWEVNVRQQQAMISNGELDIGFMSLCEKHQTEDVYIFINTEELILAVPAGHPLCVQARSVPGHEFPELDFTCLCFEPFAQMYRGSTVREFADSIFRLADFHPDILFETARVRTILDMVAAKMCCGLIPGVYANKPVEGVSFFSLPTHPTWNIMASYKRGSYLNQAAKYFIQLASDYWS